MDKNNDVYELDLRKILLIIKSNIILIIILPVAFAVIGAFASMFLITPMYQSSSLLIVNSQTSQTSQNGSITSEQLKTATELVNTYAIIITSDTVLDEVIDNLNLRSYEGMQDVTAERLANQITITAVNDTQVMRICVTNSNDVLAKAINAEIIKVAPDIIIDTVKAGSVEIISPAKSDGKVSPSNSKNTLLAFAAGLILALAIAFVRSMLDNTISSDEEITNRLGLPVLGVIPMIEGKKG